MFTYSENTLFFLAVAGLVTALIFVYYTFLDSDEITRD